jgi:DNA-binding transcriptional regulator YiaG
MKLREYLRLKRIKQKEFAALGDFSLGAVCNWISGRRKPTIKNALLIEQMTKKMVTLKDFLNED